VRGKRLAHRGRLIGVEMPAGERSSDERFLSSGSVDWGEVKGRKEGERGVLIGRSLMAINLR
jgi:hypothetical protein